MEADLNEGKSDSGQPAPTEEAPSQSTGVAVVTPEPVVPANRAVIEGKYRVDSDELPPDSNEAIASDLDTEFLDEQEAPAFPSDLDAPLPTDADSASPDTDSAQAIALADLHEDDPLGSSDPTTATTQIHAGGEPVIPPVEPSPPALSNFLDNLRKNAAGIDKDPGRLMAKGAKAMESIIKAWWNGVMPVDF